jgi:hypothetical protein
MEIELKRANARAAWPTTRWSLIGSAGAAGAQEKHQAISSIVSAYTPVLRGHLFARWRMKQDHVDDLLHEFLLSKVLVDGIIGLADRSRGRFRHFLAKALDNFVRNHFRDETRIKRGGNKIEPLDNQMNQMDSGGPPADAFDYAWARQVLGQSVRRMRMHCTKTKRRDVWGIFRGRVLRPALLELEAVAYAELVREFGLKSPRHATNVLMTATRMFARTVRGVLSLYESDERDFDDEICDLWRAVSSPRAKSGKN